MKNKTWLFAILAAGLIVAGGLWYYMDGEDEEEEEEEEVGEYNGMTITLQDYVVIREFTAMIETEQPAEIRPQVGGRLTKICVEEGATVKKGQPLFIIDQVPFQAAVKSAQSRVNSAKAQLATARQNLEGKEELYRQHIIGDFVLKKAQNELSEAEAAQAEALADLETARNELSYTVVRSPSDGMISMIDYRLGELVDPSAELPMTTVSDPRRVHAYTAISENTLYDIMQYYNCTLEQLPARLPEVTLVSYWGLELEQKGHIDAVSGDVDLKTGTIYVRATFDNPSRLFRNGSNAVLRMPYHLKNAIVIPQEATFEVQDRYFVHKVVGGVIHTTEIKVFPYNDGQTYAVTAGLLPGDVIIAEGAGLVEDSMKVKVKLGNEENVRSDEK